MDLAAVERTIAEVASREQGVAAIFLFGSTAEARVHRESDVDIAVLLDREVFPTAPARFEARLRLSATISRALQRRDVDLVVLNDVPPPLARAIVLDGRPVFVADREAEHAFRRDVMLRAADQEPFLRRTRHRKLRQLLAP